MKVLATLLLCLLGTLDAQVSFLPNKAPANVTLSGRERPVHLPHNVYVKECKSTPDGKAHLLLLYCYRDSNSSSSDYFALLLCQQETGSDEVKWKVEFLMDAANMTELWKGMFRVVELGPFEKPDSAVLKVATPLPERNDGTGEMNWERWNVEKAERLKVIAKTRPFEPLPVEK